MANPTLFGIATKTGAMPGILPPPVGAGGITHVECFNSNASTNSTVRIQGSVSGINWNSVGAVITVTAATPVWQVVSGVDYNYYRCNVTAISGGGQVSAYLGN